MMQYCPGVGHDVEFFTCRSSRKIETQLFPTSEFRAGFGRICRRDRARDESAGVLRPGIPVPVSRDAASGFLSFRGGGPFCRGGAAICRRQPVVDIRFGRARTERLTGRLPVSAIDVASFGMLAIQRFRSSAGRLRQPDPLIGCADCRSLPVEVFRRRPWGLRRDCRSRIRFFCGALRSPAVSDRAHYFFLKRTTAQPERVRVRNRSKPNCCARSVTASTSVSRIPLKNSIPPECSAAA